MAGRVPPPLQPGHFLRRQRRLLGRAMRPNARSAPPSLVKAESCSSSPSSSSAGADHARPAQADVLAEAGRGLARAGRFADRADERRDPGFLDGRTVEPVERVEQVALAELGPQLLERFRARDPVEAERVAEREQRARLARPAREGLGQLVEPGSVAAERVRLRAGGRVDAEALGLRAHRVPDASLRDAELERPGGERLGLRAPQFGVGEVGCRVEEGGAPRPASLLDAGDGDRQAAARLDEDGDVEDAVLLGADQLLAVVAAARARRAG